MCVLACACIPVCEMRMLCFRAVLVCLHEQNFKKNSNIFEKEKMFSVRQLL